MADLARRIGVRLKNARTALGLTHEEVGERIGITGTGQTKGYRPP